MIIYIYGSDDFKKEINSLLNHSNIKFRLDENGEIKELHSLEELKDAIEDNPKNIYLIDDSKIIKKNSLNQKINFLKPKDGIEQEYLLDNGIGDISVDSMEELSKHIIKRLESEIYENETNDIQDSIVEIVENAYGEDEEDKGDYVQLDDELSALLTHRSDETEEDVNIEEIDDISSMFEETKLEEDTNNNDDSIESIDALKDLSFEEDFGNIEQDKEETNQGVDMSNEFSEFDTLTEADILAALDEANIDEVSTTPLPKKSAPKAPQSSTESINVGSSSADEIAKIISQLLNNKTLEITIKVKD